MLCVRVVGCLADNGIGRAVPLGPKPDDHSLVVLRVSSCCPVCRFDGAVWYSCIFGLYTHLYAAGGGVCVCRVSRFEDRLCVSTVVFLS